MSDSAIKVENLSKRYRIGAAEKQHDTLLAAIGSWLKSPASNYRQLRQLSSFSDNGEAEDVIWALKDVSFEVEQGEVIGIIGHNGAGKSTLLKILSRITAPTEGRIELNGRVASLLEVGTGFHPELTGRENIYLNGTILGMTKAEVDRKFDEIVDFSGVEKFIDTPVKRYSSGMKVRLAFSVAAHLEAEILLIDEVLAVGDAEFQQKCLGKMGDVASSGRTILFVSHNMGAITRLCPRSIWLQSGKLQLDSETEDIVPLYLSANANSEGKFVYKPVTNIDNITDFQLVEVSILNHQGKTTNSIDVRKPLWFEIKYKINKQFPHCRVGVIVSTVDGINVFDAYDSDQKQYASTREPGVYISRVKIPANFLSPRRYVVSLKADAPGIARFVKLNDILVFDIQNLGGVGSHMGGRRFGVIRPQLKWELKKVGD